MTCFQMTASIWHGRTDALIGVGSIAASPAFAERVFFDDFAIDITPAAAAVPEPVTWALLIAGFGMVGVGMRRRRPVAA